MRWKSHVRFGGRVGETHASQDAQGAPARPDTWGYLPLAGAHPTGEGKLYLCAVKDAWSGRIVGYSLASRMKASLAVAALRNAVALRDPAPGLVVHSEPR